MPRLTRQKEAAEVDRMLQDMVAAQPDFILIHAYSDAQRLAEFAPQMPFYVAPTLNVFNQESLRFWQQHGASAIFLSQELTLAQIRGILRQYDGSLGVYACGRTELWRRKMYRSWSAELVTAGSIGKGIPFADGSVRAYAYFQFSAYRYGAGARPSLAIRCSQSRHRCGIAFTK